VRDRADEAAAKTGARAMTDFRPLLGDIDAVTVAVPTVAHLEVELQAHHGAIGPRSLEGHALQDGEPAAIQRSPSPDSSHCRRANSRLTAMWLMTAGASL